MSPNKNIIHILSFITCFILLLLTFNRGINYFDEGYIVEGARKMMGGEVAYRDFHFIYPPGAIEYLSFFFRIGGQYLIVERMAAMTMSIIGVISLWLLVMKLTRNRGLAAASMFIYVLWGPVHINFLWPVMMVLPLLFLFMYLIMQSHMAAAGIVLGFMLLCKHNLGAAVLIGLIIHLLISRPSKGQLLSLGKGLLGTIGIFLSHLLLTGSFMPFIADMNRYSVQEILLRRSFSTPFPTQTLPKFFLYLFPGAISFCVGILFALKKQFRRYLFIPLTLLLLYLFSIFPTPDWTHLTPLISFTGLACSLVFMGGGKRIRAFCILLLGIIIAAGSFSGYFRNWYRWEAPLPKHTHCFSSTRMRYMCVDAKNWAVLSLTGALIDKEARSDSYIFSFYNNPLAYFITQKDNPSPYIDFNVLVGRQEESRVVKNIQSKKVNIIITRFPPRDNNSVSIYRYIENNFDPIQKIYEFTVWKRRVVPK